MWGGGWLADMGALDFAGGTVVHVNAGVAALVAAFVVGARRDYKKSPLLPHNVPFTLLGAGLLWFGWFGFNAGSALVAGELAALAFTTTFLAPMGTLVVWTMLDYMRSGKPTAVGAATAIVVGLVAITPAAGFIGPMSAIALGAIAAVPSYFGLIIRAKTQLDDSLDVVAAHGVGGTVGALLTGVFAQKALNSAGNDGLLFGNPGQLGVQAMAVVAAMVYSGVGQLHPAEDHRRGHPAARQRAGRKRRPRRRACTAKKRTCRRARQRATDPRIKNASHGLQRNRTFRCSRRQIGARLQREMFHTEGMERVNGLHHITAIAGPAQENLDFYAGVLGMRLVKRSVNQDDPGTYHLFYADADGHPGTDLTFFPWTHLAPPRMGHGLAVEVGLEVPAGSLEYWAARLETVRHADSRARNALRRHGAAGHRSSRPEDRAGRERHGRCDARSRPGMTVRCRPSGRSEGCTARRSGSARRRRARRS